MPSKKLRKGNDRDLHEKHKQSCSSGVSLSQSKIIVQREETKIFLEGEMGHL